MDHMTFRERLSARASVISMKVVYALNLRRVFSAVSRKIFDDSETARIPDYGTPEKVQDVLKVLKWRSDPMSGNWDYITDPRHIQYLVNKHQGQFEAEDCDGIHFYAGTLLSRMNDVSKVRLYSIKYRGGAHAVCAYTYRGKKFLYDYRIYEMDRYRDIPCHIASRYSKDKSEVVMWYVIERISSSDSLPFKPRIYMGK